MLHDPRAAPRPGPWRWAETALATTVWLVCTTGPVIWLRTRWTLSGDLAEDPAYIALCVVLGVVCAAVLLADRARTAAVLTDPELRRTWAALLALVLVLTVSAAWSADRALTFTHGIRLLGTVAMGLFLVVRLGAIVQIATAWLAVQIGCTWSALQIQRLVEGTQDRRGNWVGIFVNRNSLGLVSAVGVALGMLLTVHVLTTWSGRRRIAAGIVLLGASLLDLRLLVGSGSATPTAVLALIAVAAAAVVAMRRVGVRPGRGLLAWSAGVLTVGVVASSTILPLFSDALGRGGDLSRREPLWEVVRGEIADRPLWGYGYLGIWEDRSFLRELRREVRGRDLVTAHNSALEVVLGAGVVALALFVVVLLLGARRAIRASLDVRSPAAALWPLTALLWFALESTTETFLVADTLPTLLLVVAVLASAEPGHDSRPIDQIAAGEGPALADQSR